MTSEILDGARDAILKYLCKGHTTDSLTVARVLPDWTLAWPIGIEKEGFDNNDIHTPYKKFMGIPFYDGDYAFGIDFSYYSPWYIGFYSGTYIKSQEIIFKENDEHLRSFALQPRGGLSIHYKGIALEGGVFFDIIVGAGGNFKNSNIEMLKNGLGLEFSLTLMADKKLLSITYSMPLHNFLNENYKDASGANPFDGMKRRIGYIMLNYRFIL